MRKIFYYHFCMVVVICHWFCNNRILRFHLKKYIKIHSGRYWEPDWLFILTIIFQLNNGKNTWSSLKMQWQLPHFVIGQTVRYQRITEILFMFNQFHSKSFSWCPRYVTILRTFLHRCLYFLHLYSHNGRSHAKHTLWSKKVYTTEKVYLNLRDLKRQNKIFWASLESVQTIIFSRVLYSLT